MTLFDELFVHVAEIMVLEKICNPDFQLTVIAKMRGLCRNF